MANPLDGLKTKKKIKRYIKGAHFDFDEPEISYTSGLGAASGLNEPFLLKSLEKDPIDQKDDTPNQNINEEGETNMSDQAIEKEVALLRKELAIEKTKNSLGKYDFDSETLEGVASAMADLEKEGQEAIEKALQFLVDCGEYGVAIAKEKSPKTVEEANELAKMLSEEVGEDGNNDEPVDRASAIEKKTQEAIEKAKGGK